MLAWEVLRAVDERGAYANILLPALLAERRLAARDRAFATELAYGALRAQGLLDAVLDTVASRPVAGVDPPLRDALRLGAYQLIYTRVPPRAAVATTVDLVRATGTGTGGEGPARFANAVLRRVAAQVAETGGDLAAMLDAPPFARDPLGHLAVVTAHPRWVVDTFADALHGDMPQTRLALEADDARPAVHLVAYPGRIGADELAEQARGLGLTATPGPYSPYAVRLDGGDPGRLPAVRAGLAGVQDEGSQLVALAAARAPRTGADRGVVVDLCAGPGGKAALLAALLPELLPELLPGGRLVAIEPHPTRARMVARALACTQAAPATADGVAAEAAVADAASESFEAGSRSRKVDTRAVGTQDLAPQPARDPDVETVASRTAWNPASRPDGTSGRDPGRSGDVRIRPSHGTPDGSAHLSARLTSRSHGLPERVSGGERGISGGAGREAERGRPPGYVVAQADGREPPLPLASADLVLVDAPCTGLGALRRRPEARWRKSPTDVAALAGLQRQLLAAALDLARPGGVVAYATCSPHPAETEAVVSEVVAAMPGRVSVLDARGCLPEVGDLGDGPFVQLWPHRHGTDAMFIAILRRTGR
jgi:16S rRNA C967 or C1407 C5-methylase (RsmB/RsmF family)